MRERVGGPGVGGVARQRLARATLGGDVVAGLLQAEGARPRTKLVRGSSSRHSGSTRATESRIAAEAPRKK